MSPLRRIGCLGALALALTGALAQSAAAGEEFDKYALEAVSASLSSRQAGAHADMTIAVKINRDGNQPYAITRDVEVKLPPGMLGNPLAAPRCTAEQLGDGPNNSHCPFDTQVGTIEVRVLQPNPGVYLEPLYNMEAPKGMVARLGFIAVGWPTFVSVRLDPVDHTVIAASEGIPAAAGLMEATTRVWGVPGSPAHDEDRITPKEAESGERLPGGRPGGEEVPFLTNPTECGEERQVTVTARSYQLPEAPSRMSAPFPQITGCGLLDFNPTVSLAPTTSQASSGSGLDYRLSLPDEGLLGPRLLYGSELRRDRVALPVGMTINPSEAEGLGVCTEADLARESYDSGPNQGCPETSKIGNVVADTPVVEQKAEGALFLAKPYENPTGSLIALYLVLKIPERGVLVKLAGKVEPDPVSGQLITTFDEVPQLPVSDFTLHFKEGARAPLITPRTCGTYDAVSEMTPWADPASPLTRLSSFAIESGPNHGPCPGGGVPPFEPGFTAGTENNAAGSFSPMVMRLTRRDGDQDLTKFSATLPPGLVAKLAGTSECPDSAIAQARSRSGRNGGHEELASPSCPASSEIGRVLAGAGVGDVLTNAEGKVYLAGPYKGAPLSVVAIVPAVAGPFDVGTVVTRQALRLNPRTGVVTVDGESSDPIPHILAGIPLTVRDIRVYVDRPDFTLNPTSCEPLSTEATIWGGGNDVFSSLDDSPHSLAERFQAADCAALGFKPRLGLTLKGGTGRGGHPALTGTYRPRKGDANLKGLVLRLPRSAFLDQAHIRTICTRVQYAANGGNGAGCPKGSIYGHATAYTPILDKPLEGPVFLRSSNHNLPDFVAALHGLVDVEAVARIDSQHGGIRATFSNLPDAPIARVVVKMQGAKKGLIVNSTDLCAGEHRADAQFAAHNGRKASGRPEVRVDCGGKRKHKRK